MELIGMDQDFQAIQENQEGANSKFLVPILKCYVNFGFFGVSFIEYTPMVSSQNPLQRIVSPFHS